jgi:hypothetical protein
LTLCAKSVEVNRSHFHYTSYEAPFAGEPLMLPPTMDPRPWHTEHLRE